MSDFISGYEEGWKACIDTFIDAQPELDEPVDGDDESLVDHVRFLMANVTVMLRSTSLGQDI